MIYWFGLFAAIALGLAVISGRGQLSWLRFFSGLIFIVLGVIWSTTDSAYLPPSIPRGSQANGAIMILLFGIGVVVMVSAFVRNLTVRKSYGDGHSEEWHAFKMPHIIETLTKSEETKRRETKKKKQDDLDEYQARIHAALNPPPRNRLIK